MDEAVRLQLQHITYDTLTRDLSVWISWLEKALHYESDILAAGTYSAQRSWANALTYLSDLVTTYNLSGTTLLEHNRYESIIELLEDAYEDDRSIDNLSSVELDTLSSIRDRSFGFAKNTATSILMLYDTNQVISFQLPGQGIQERSSGSVADQQYKSQLILYPNPTSGNLLLKWINFDSEGARLKLFNLTGIQVLDIELTQSVNEIKAEDLSRGIYLYQITKNGEGVFNGKILIQ